MHTFDITDFGASSHHDSTESVQSAAEACREAGGGRIHVPAGIFPCGTIFLHSNTELHLEAGSTLQIIPRKEDLRQVAKSEEDPCLPRFSWICALRARNISITGTGTIDIQADAFISDRTVPEKFVDWRPQAILFHHCENVRIRDVTIRDPAFWCVHFSGCDNVVVDGVSVLSEAKLPNCDGIDIDHSRNVRISNCLLRAGDDCICIKNTRGGEGPCEDIIVSNCIIETSSCAIKLGSESTDDMRRIRFHNCIIRGSNRALGIQLRDEGNIEDVTFSDITIQTRRVDDHWWGCAEPIYVTSLPRNDQTRQGAIRRLSFHNIQAQAANGIFVYASAPDRIESLSITGLRLTMVPPAGNPPATYDPRPCELASLPPGYKPYGEVTPWGCKCTGNMAAIFLYNAETIRLVDSQIDWLDAGEGFHSALIVQNVDRLICEGCDFPEPSIID